MSTHSSLHHLPFTATTSVCSRRSSLHDALDLGETPSALTGRLLFSAWGSEVVAGGVSLNRAVALTDSALYLIPAPHCRADVTAGLYSAQRFPVEALAHVAAVGGGGRAVRVEVAANHGGLASITVLCFSNASTAAAFCAAVESASSPSPGAPEGAPRPKPGLASPSPRPASPSPTEPATEGLPCPSWSFPSPPSAPAPLATPPPAPLRPPAAGDTPQQRGGGMRITVSPPPPAAAAAPLIPAREPTPAGRWSPGPASSRSRSGDSPQRWEPSRESSPRTPRIVARAIPGPGGAAAAALQNWRRAAGAHTACPPPAPRVLRPPPVAAHSSPPRLPSPSPPPPLLRLPMQHAAAAKAAAASPRRHADRAAAAAWAAPQSRPQRAPRQAQLEPGAGDRELLGAALHADYRRWRRSGGLAAHGNACRAWTRADSAQLLDRLRELRLRLHRRDAPGDAVLRVERIIGTLERERRMVCNRGRWAGAAGGAGASPLARAEPAQTAARRSRSASPPLSGRSSPRGPGAGSWSPRRLQNGRTSPRGAALSLLLSVDRIPAPAWQPAPARRRSRTPGATPRGQRPAAGRRRSAPAGARSPAYAAGPPAPPPDSAQCRGEPGRPGSPVALAARRQAEQALSRRSPSPRAWSPQAEPAAAQPPPAPPRPGAAAALVAAGRAAAVARSGRRRRPRSTPR
eukprot:TRINITY_DN5258_c0_g1_i1.p1 TRINITY_DN5258_c0_g1~~TRINITY_DN5258_c0_g1_i1.p1  ORF type:complete len:713 (+),score=137.41 TRINITY_DN5258_c0_g1_i1:80-2140(+)